MTHTKLNTEEKRSEWEEASFYGKWSFSFANNMLNAGESEILELDRLLRTPKEYNASRMVEILKQTYRASKPFWFIPRLMVAMIRMTFVDSLLSSTMSFVDSGCMAIAPLFLQYLLQALETSTTTECFMWAAILSGTAVVQVLVRHALYFIAMRTGWNWKNASTALIYDKLLTMDAGRLQNAGAGTGMMVNLISNDVARFEEFATVSLFLALLGRPRTF
jgi:hypothetical protein